MTPVITDPERIREIVRAQGTATLVQTICGLRFDSGDRVRVVTVIDGEPATVLLAGGAAVDAARDELNRRVPR